MCNYSWLRCSASNNENFPSSWVSLRYSVPDTLLAEDGTSSTYRSFMEGKVVRGAFKASVIILFRGRKLYSVHTILMLGSFDRIRNEAQVERG